MARTVDEWIGKDDDDWPPPADCQLRVVRRSDGKCVHCGRTFDPKLPAEMDHKRDLGSSTLWPGENLNVESNLQALCHECHVQKSGEDKTKQAELKRYERKKYGIKTAKERRKRPIPRRPKTARVKTAWWAQDASTETEDGI